MLTAPTYELPLSLYCFIGGCIYTWGRPKQPGGDMWFPLGMIIEDNALAQAMLDVLGRSRARAFKSVEEAMAWVCGEGAALLSGPPEGNPATAPGPAA